MRSLNGSSKSSHTASTDHTALFTDGSPCQIPATHRAFCIGPQLVHFLVAKQFHRRVARVTHEFLCRLLRRFRIVALYGAKERPPVAHRLRTAPRGGQAEAGIAKRLM